MALLCPAATLGALLPAAGAVHTSASGVFQNVTFQTLELDVTEAAAPGATIYLPLNASARVLNASFVLSSSPGFASTLLTGDGAAARSDEGFGYSMEGYGDYNGDGFDDLAVGAPVPVLGTALPGRVDVFYGSSSGLRPSRNWSYTGPNASQFAGPLAHGDVNGDGYDDLLVGEEEQGFRGTAPETVHIFFGSSSGLSLTPNVRLYGHDPSQLTGWSWGMLVTDWNGDGYNDLLAAESDFRGAPFDNDAAVAVFLGRPGGVDFGNRTYFYPPNPPYREWGGYMRAIGDNDGDGLPEVLAGDQRYNGNLGSAGTLEATPNSTEAIWLWSYNGTIPAQVGGHAEGGADVTGDGRNDIVLVLPGYQLSTGGAYVFAGQPNGSYAPAPTFVLEGREEGENFGEDASFCNIDGDSVADLVVGASRFTSDSEGGAYLYTDGNLTESSRSYFKGGMAGRAEAFGKGTKCLGDLNADGYEDFAVWLEFGYNGTTQPGAVRIYYGKAQPFAEDVTVTMGGNSLFAKAGPMKGWAPVADFGTGVNAYLAAHTAEADASGTVQVPITVRFDGGGRVSLSQIFVRYTVVLPPDLPEVVSAPSGDALIVSWAARAPATDGSQVAIWSNKSGAAWKVIAVVGVPRTSYADPLVTEGLPVYYRLEEWDPQVNLYSAPSAVVSGVPRDVVPPSAPSGFAAVADAPNHAASLVWARSSDDTVAYELWREDGDAAGFLRLATVDQPGTAFFDSALEEEVNYTYKLRAVDDVGLASPFTEPAAVRIADSAAPPSPRGLRGDSAPSGTAIVASWTANEADTVEYAVSVSAPGTATGFVEVGRTTFTMFTVAGLQRGATYYLQVEALDRVGHRSPPASTAVTTIDVEGPSAPVITRAEAAPEGGAIVLEWAAAEDDIASFQIGWRAGGLEGSVPIADGAARAFTLTGLTNDVRVDVRITAEDRTGLVGTDSDPVSVIPHDSVAPATPVGILLAPVPEGGALRISWTAPPDPSVAGYKVYYRLTGTAGSLALAGAVSAGATSFIHRGLENLVSYTYGVAAIDGAANEGGMSQTVQGVPHDTLAPDPPILAEIALRTNVAGVVVTGSAPKGTQVEIEVGGQPAGIATLDASGAFATTVALTAGENRVRARASDLSSSVDATAKFSEYSPEVKVTLDQTAPRITASSPAEGAKGVGVSSALTFTANEPLDAGTVTATLRQDQGPEIRVTVTYDEALQAVTITPAIALAPGARYTLTLKGADLAGNALAPVSVSFQAEERGSDLALPLLSAGIVGASVVAAVFVGRRAKAKGRTDR